jgi:hypothetical protein
MCKGGMDKVITSSLNLVDLAGSERQKDTLATGLRLKVYITSTFVSVIFV